MKTHTTTAVIPQVFTPLEDHAPEELLGDLLSGEGRDEEWNGQALLVPWQPGYLPVACLRNETRDHPAMNKTRQDLASAKA